MLYDVIIRTFLTGEISWKTLGIDQFEGDATDLPLRDKSIDIIIADMPFGRRHGSHMTNQKLYPRMIRESARVLRIGGQVCNHTENILSNSKITTEILSMTFENLHRILFLFFWKYFCAINFTEFRSKKFEISWRIIDVFHDIRLQSFIQNHQRTDIISYRSDTHLHSIDYYRWSCVSTFHDDKNIWIHEIRTE